MYDYNTTGAGGYAHGVPPGTGKDRTIAGRFDGDGPVTAFHHMDDKILGYSPRGKRAHNPRISLQRVAYRKPDGTVGTRRVISGYRLENIPPVVGQEQKRVRKISNHRLRRAGYVYVRRIKSWVAPSLNPAKEDLGLGGGTGLATWGGVTRARPLSRRKT